MEYKHCPNCKVDWKSKQTITEYFTEVYELHGIPEYLTKIGIINVVAAARNTAESYGDTPFTPRHFGINHTGIELDRDRTELWGCYECGAIVDCYTGDVKVQNDYSAMLLKHRKARLN